jgi:hypothetical protein
MYNEAWAHESEEEGAADDRCHHPRICSGAEAVFASFMETDIGRQGSGHTFIMNAFLFFWLS